jgi:hypothetical protein
MDGQHTRHHGVDGVTAVLVELLAIQIAGPDLELHRGTPDGLLPNGSCVLMMIVGRIHPTGRWQGNVGGSLIDIVGARTADARITITMGGESSKMSRLKSLRGSIRGPSMLLKARNSTSVAW